MTREEPCISEEGGPPETEEPLHEHLCFGIETGRNVTQFFPSHARRIADSAGLADYPVIPDDACLEGTEIFNWGKW